MAAGSAATADSPSTWWCRRPGTWCRSPIWIPWPPRRSPMPRSPPITRSSAGCPRLARGQRPWSSGLAASATWPSSCCAPSATSASSRWTSGRAPGGWRCKRARTRPYPASTGRASCARRRAGAGPRWCLTAWPRTTRWRWPRASSLRAAPSPTWAVGADRCRSPPRPCRSGARCTFPPGGLFPSWPRWWRLPGRGPSARRSSASRSARRRTPTGGCAAARCAAVPWLRRTPVTHPMWYQLAVMHIVKIIVTAGLASQARAHFFF